LASIASPLKEAQNKFYEAAGFFEVPGAKPKHIFLGVILSFGCLAAGDLASLLSF